MFSKFLGKAKNRPIENQTSDKNEAVVISRRKIACPGKDTRSEKSRGDNQRLQSSDNARRAGGVSVSEHVARELSPHSLWGHRMDTMESWRIN